MVQLAKGLLVLMGNILLDQLAHAAPNLMPKMDNVLVVVTLTA